MSLQIEPQTTKHVCTWIGKTIVLPAAAQSSYVLPAAVLLTLFEEYREVLKRCTTAMNQLERSMIRVHPSIGMESPQS
jgi:hypothetical protein